MANEENNYILEINDYRVKILMVNKKEKHKMLPLILKCIISDENIFYNINEGDTELSFVIDIRFEEFTKKLPCVYYPDIYRVIQIHENGSGIDHIGIVSEISSLFTDINISILYINTYNNNFILIKENDYKKGIDALSKIGFIIK